MHIYVNVCTYMHICMHVCVCVYARVRGCAHTCTRTDELDKLNQATGVWLHARGKECGICGTFHEPRAHAATRRSPSGSRSWGLRTPSAPPTPIINVQ